MKTIQTWAATALFALPLMAQAQGIENLGSGAAYAFGISADGTVVVGRNFSDSRGFRWTQATGMVNLGTLSGGYWSGAYGVSADGLVVVGLSDSSAGDRAFRWTQATNMVDLGVLTGGSESWANAVSDDGSVVVGSSDSSAGYRAFRWTQATDMVDLGVLSGGSGSWGNGVSADGTVVVGTSNSSAGYRAFRWTQASNMVDLGVLAGGSASEAYGVSADGAVVVGQSNSSVGLRGFRWTETTGMQSVEDWLTANGVSVGAVTTESAAATNADGSIVVGRLTTYEAFIARVASSPLPYPGGLVTLADVQKSLAATAGGGSLALSSANVVMNGAHSRPLARRVAAGRNTFWLGGDWGRDDHGSRSGDFGLLEVGAGRNFGAAQVNVSLGQTWAKQKQTLGGRTKVDGTYLLAEALLPVSGNLWGVLGGYLHRGDADMKRGYLNAGLPDTSSASPDVNTYGLRARLEWDKAARLADADFSPYVDLSYSKAKLDAYTETGGAFPARFDSRKEKATELRLGVNAERALTGSATLFGMLEGVHRFEKHGARTSGEMIGLFGFDLDGYRNKRNWLRVGAGVAGEVAGGTASLSVNLTTQGEAPNAWLAANWQRAF